MRMRRTTERPGSNKSAELATLGLMLWGLVLIPIGLLWTPPLWGEHAADGEALAWAAGLLVMVGLTEWSWSSRTAKALAGLARIAIVLLALAWISINLQTYAILRG